MPLKCSFPHGSFPDWKGVVQFICHQGAGIRTPTASGLSSAKTAVVVGGTRSEVKLKRRRRRQGRLLCPAIVPVSKSKYKIEEKKMFRNEVYIYAVHSQLQIEGSVLLPLLR